MSSQFCQSSQPKKGSEEDKKYGNININLRVKAKENKKILNKHKIITDSTTEKKAVFYRVIFIYIWFGLNHVKLNVCFSQKNCLYTTIEFYRTIQFKNIHKILSSIL